MCRLTPTRMSGHSSTARMADRIGITAVRCAKYPWPDATIRPTTTQTILTSDEKRDLMTAPRTADRVVTVHTRIPGAELAESRASRTPVLADMRVGTDAGPDRLGPAPVRSRREARAGPTGRSDLTSLQPLAHPSRA